MHELSIMGNILDIILEYANKNNAKEITKVNLTIGVMSDIIPEWAQNYFDMLSKDTIANNAKLIIEQIPARIKCLDCGEETTIDSKNWDFSCSKCTSGKIELISGRELQVSSIEIK